MILLSPGLQSKPRILRFLSRVAVGGVQNGLIESLARADRDRFDFAVVCYKKAGNWAHRVEALGIPVCAQKTLPVWGPYQLLRLARLIRTVRPDLIHIQQAESVIPGATAAWMAGVRHLIVHHTSLYTGHWSRQNPLLNRWEWAWTRRAGARIAVSETVARVSAQGLGLDPAMFDVIPNGVNVERWSRPQPYDLRAELGVGRERALVGHVARYHPVKRIEDFIEAAVLVGRERLLPTAIPPPIYLVIGGGERALRERYEAMIREARPWADVRLLGTRHDLPRLLPNLTVGALPSLIEGCPNTILEYLCAGVAIAASDIDSIRALVNDGEQGLLSPPKAPEALARSIARLLTDADLRARLTVAGQRRALLYDWGRTQARYEALYERLLRAGMGENASLSTARPANQPERGALAGRDERVEIEVLKSHLTPETTQQAVGDAAILIDRQNDARRT